MEIPLGKINTTANRMEPYLLHVEDLNTLITFLKRREENMIQILNFKTKHQYSIHQEEKDRLQDLIEEIKKMEELRLEKEDEVVYKYLNHKISDEKQKRLIERLIHKVLQIKSKVKDKLSQLNISTISRGNWDEISFSEIMITNISNKTEIDIESLLMFLIISSRFRLLHVLLEENHNCQIICDKVSEFLQELSNFTNPKIINHIRNIINVSLNINPPQKMDGLFPHNIQEVVSHPLKPPTFITANIRKHIPNNNIECENISTYIKLTEQLAEKSISVTPYCYQFSDAQMIERRDFRDSRGKKILPPKVEHNYKDLSGQSKTFSEGPSANLKMTSNLEMVVNREKTKRKIMNYSAFCEKTPNNLDLITQESENTDSFFAVNNKASTSYEGIRVTEFENIDQNQQDSSASVMQTTDGEMKNDYITKNYINLKDESPSNIHEEIIEGDKRLEDFSQKSRKSVYKSRLKMINSKTPTSTQFTESSFSAALGNFGSSVRIFEMIKAGKGYSKDDFSSSIDVKEPNIMKTNLSDACKNYDIMNLEYRPIVVIKKKNAKKAFMDKVYNDLINLNVEIKKGITKYLADFPVSKVNIQTMIKENEMMNPNTKESPQRYRINYDKQSTKTRRSVSIENPYTSKNNYKRFGYKFYKDMKSGTGSKLDINNTSTSQIDSTLFPKNIQEKMQISKPIQKLFILPQLNLIDSSKTPNSFQNNDATSQFPMNCKTMTAMSGFIRGFTSQNALTVSFKKTRTKYSNNEADPPKLRDLLEKPSIPQLNSQSVSNRELTLEKKPDENNHSMLQAGSSYESKMLANKINNEDPLNYDLVKKGLRAAGSTHDKRREFPELKNRVTKFNLEFGKPYPTPVDGFAKFDSKKVPTQ